MYRHIERLDALVWFYAAALTLVFALYMRGLVDGAMAPVLLILGFAVLLTSRMTTEVRDGVFTVSLGPGLFPSRVPLGEIRGLHRIEVPPSAGFGLRLRPGVRV